MEARKKRPPPRAAARKKPVPPGTHGLHPAHGPKPAQIDEAIARMPIPAAYASSPEALELKSGEAPTRSQLRLQALIAFCYDPRCASVTDLMRQELFKDIPEGTIRKWAAQDEWTRHRRDAVSLIKVRLAERLADRQAEAFLETAEDISVMKEKLRVRLGNENFQDVSGDKLVAAYMRIVEGEVKLFGLGPQILSPPDKSGTTTPEQQQHANVPELDIEERRIAANAVIQYRREKRRAAAIDTKAKDVTPKDATKFAQGRKP